MSDSSNPSVQRQNEGNETEPHGGGSSASSLGAPAPDPEHDAEPAREPASKPASDADIKGDPDQVT